MHATLSSELAWMIYGPVMMLSYVPKPKKNVILMSTMHDSDDIAADNQRKPELIHFYNSQRCGLDIVNEMLKHHSSQPTSNNWPIVVFTFILDLCAVNGSCNFSYNCPKEFINRRTYIEQCALQLVTPHMLRRLQQVNLKLSTRNSIENVLKHPSVKPPIPAEVI